MSQIELAVKCRQCGRWKGLVTSDIRKANFNCGNESCSEFFKPKVLYSTPCGFNFHKVFIKENHKINDVVARLNQKQNEK